MNPRLSLTATSHPDEDRMIVEIWVDGRNIAEVVEAQPDYEVLLYPNPGGGPWSLPRQLLIEAVEAASARMDALLGR